MRALVLLAGTACALACAARAPQTTSLPPTTEERDPGSGLASQQPQSLSELQPVSNGGLADVPRIGAIDGRIVAVAGDKLAVRGHAVAGDRADVSMFMGPVTRVTIDGKPARPNELRPGMDVRASYTQSYSTVIADHVDATTRPPTPPPPR